ncbi:helix-turn-helix transcriptional regulator [Vibrio fluvialis]
MKTYHFLLVTSKSGVTSDNELFDLSDDLYEAGCDDATIATYNGTIYLSFYRESESYGEAVLSAIQDVEKVNQIQVVSVDAGDWVGLSDAAELSGITKSALSRYSKGERGTGGFPSPVQRIDSKTPLWSWSDIADWLEKKGKVDQEIVDNAKLTSTINISLQLRNAEKMREVMGMLDRVHGSIPQRAACSL